ncbi:general secretion pathway protein H [Vibrio cholerae 623-39]|nr:general secretion pathway protein H [Vibrio cholerae 623-39]KNH53295.1 general secretion pathway protein H [Vibrio cholerae 623-39]
MPDLVLEFQADAALVESVGSSTVSKSLKIHKPLSFNVVGCSTRSAWFHK